MTVPYTFGTATTSIPLSNLDANFNTPITLGNTSIYLGNTTTTIGNLTLTNATISSGNVTISNISVTTANVTTANVATLSVTGIATIATANITTGNITTLTSTSITDSGLTSGRVTFAGASGLLSDSANLVWDNTNARLGIGTSSPSYPLSVAKAGNSSIVLAQLRNSDAGSSAATSFAFGNDTSAEAARIVYGSSTNSTIPNTLFITNDLAGSIILRTDGTERMRITSAGNVGIGTSTPDVFSRGYGTILAVSNTGVNGASIAINSGTSTYPALELGRGGVRTALLTSQSTVLEFGSIEATPLAFFTNSAERARIDSNGNVGIGNTIPGSFDASANRLVVGNGSANQGISIYGSSTANLFFAKGTAGSDPYVGFINYTFATDHMAFYTAGANERMRINSSGNLLVGTTSSYGGERFTLDFTGSAQRGMVVRNTTSTTQDSVAFIVNSTFVGWISASTTATSYNSISDYRLKENVVPMTGALAKVAQLKPVTYKWKTDGSDGQGFIAHELAEVCPSAVSGYKDAVDENGKIKPQGVDTSFLVATLTAAIQEQQALIESLTTRLTTLESK